MPMRLVKKIRFELGLSVLLLMLFVFFVSNIHRWVIETLPATIHPVFFPAVVTGFLVFLSVLLVLCNIKALWQVHHGTLNRMQLEQYEGSEDDHRIGAITCYIGIMVIYLVGLHYIGFVYSTPAIMFVLSMMLGLKNRLWGIISYLLFAYALNYVVLNFMQILLPSGVLFK